MTAVDLTPVLQAIVGILALVIGTLGTIAFNRLMTRLGYQIDAAQQQQFDGALTKSVQAAGVQLEHLAAEKGWDHPEVKSAIVASGLSYLISRFPDAVKAVGLDPNDPATLSRVRGAVERIFPTAIAPVAASPATTNGPAPQ